jgi:hypothetical protein
LLAKYSSVTKVVGKIVYFSFWVLLNSWSGNEILIEHLLQTGLFLSVHHILSCFLRSLREQDEDLAVKIESVIFEVLSWSTLNLADEYWDQAHQVILKLGRFSCE